MHKLVVVVAVMAVAVMPGCTLMRANGQGSPVSIGPDTYKLNGRGNPGDRSGGAVRVRLLQDAVNLCHAQGKSMKPLTGKGHDATQSDAASAEVQFKCVPA